MNTRKVKQPEKHTDVIYESSPENSSSIPGVSVYEHCEKYPNATKVLN